MDVINSLLRAAKAGNLKRVIEFIEDDLVDINSANQNGLTALHTASKEGHVRIVQELIEHGANLHAKTLKGNTPLHIASLAGPEQVVKVLIESGADVNVQSASGFTPLYMASQENHVGIVKMLLASGADQNLATADGFTPLAVAMQQGHEIVASILLNNEAKGRIRFPGTTESGRSLLHIAAKKDDTAAAALLMQNNISPDVTSKSGFTALHVACHYGNLAVAKLLIDRQADVNFKAKHNITPLHVAAKWGQQGLVDLLLANSAKIEATTRDGLTPLHCAARSGHDNVVDNLIRRGAPISAKTRSGLAPLHMATQGDHLKSAQILLNNGAPVDDVTVDYLTALHVASHCGHVKVAKLLLNNKADPNFRALNGFTSLHIACKKNRIEIVKLLLKYGASLNAVTESGLTPLHVASFMGCLNIVIHLLDNHANIESVTVRGETPLHLATRANQIEVINVLLKYGANVSARAKESQTALHIAARLGNADIARLLIEQGINVDAPTKDSYTALHIASKEAHQEVVSVLLNHGANIACATRNHGFTPLHLASKYGNDAIVDLLLRYGAPVDAQGKNGVTPLHVATHYNHPNVVGLLLMNRSAGGATLVGASPHAMAKNGYTALHIAAKGNRLDIADTLLQYNANPNSESKAGFSPLHLSAQENHTDMTTLLLNSGANVNCKAKNGITPLHLCAQEDHVNVAQILVKRGAYLNEQTKGGFTPLHVASHFARIKMIRFLLANGANVNLPASSGYTPLHQASQQGNPQIVELLLEYNAKPDALTENGQTALSIAQNLGYVSIIDTLKVVTETIVKTTTMTITEEKFKIITPETMQETFVSDSEDEADDTAHADTVKFLTTDVMKNFNSSMADDYHTSQSNLMAGEANAGQQQPTRNQPSRASSRQQVVVDEMSQDLNYLNRDAPLDGGESEAFGLYSQLGGAQRSAADGSVLNMGSDLQQQQQQHEDDEAFSRRLLESPELGYTHNEQALNQLSPDNVEIQRPLQQAGFLVSFMVDARGGAMRGCRHSGVRVIIPPHSAPMPMRITCRYLRQERLVHPPPLMEGEACASKIMEVGPAGASFLGPVLIEVPHFASLRGQEREIIILRSDRGEVWREHVLDVDEKLVDSIIEAATERENVAPSSGVSSTGTELGDKRRLTRILTYDFPQYFAIISRIRQEVHPVGPEGSTVNSQAVPRVQAIFTEGALTKRIKIGLQPKAQKKHDNEHNATQEATAQDNQQQLDSLQMGNFDELASQTRPLTPGSNSGEHQRPSSALKRRSKLLACFGTGAKATDSNGDILNTTDESSSGGDSPQRSHKKSKRNAAGELDSEGEFRCSPSPDSFGAGQQQTLVVATSSVECNPENYYIEKEPPLILNLPLTTYGKRLASSSAQTDDSNKRQAMSTCVRKKPKSRSFLIGKKRDKAQLNINMEPSRVNGAATGRPKSANLSHEPAAVVDSSLESALSANELDEDDGGDADDDVIPDVSTSDDHKWRTCTIQTDSDSLTVNYVSIASDDANERPQANAGKQQPAKEAGEKASAGAADDGYVSGSGDIKQGKSRKFFAGLASFSSSNKEKEAAIVEPKRKKARKADAVAVAVSSSLDSEKELRGELAASANDNAIVEEEEKQQVSGEQQTLAERAVNETSTATPTTATNATIGQSAKELKLRQKLEKEAKAKREKEEKRQKKELEDAEQKELKSRKKQEKEAKKLAKKQAKKSPSPVPAEVPMASIASETTSTTTDQVMKPAAQVTFANVLVEQTPVKLLPEEANNNNNNEDVVAKFDESNQRQQQQHEPLAQLGSLQQVMEESSASYEQQKERLAQEDGHDLLDVSISEKISESQKQQKDEEDNDDDQGADKLISFSESVKSSSSAAVATDDSATATLGPLKPILKHQAQSSESTVAEIVISEERKISSVANELVMEATEEAVKIADSLKGSAEQSPASSPSKKELAKAAKEEKERLKREAKLKLEEERKLEKEAKKAKELEAKKAKEEKKRLEKEAKEAKKKLKLEAKKSSSPTIEQQKTCESLSEQMVSSSSASAAPAEELDNDNKLAANESSRQVVDDQFDRSKSIVEDKSAVGVGEVSQIVAAAEEPSSISVSAAVENKAAKGKADKKAKKDKKKSKEVEKVVEKGNKKRSAAESATDESESTEQPSSSKSLSFLERLFKRPASKAKAKEPSVVAAAAAASLDSDEASAKEAKAGGHGKLAAAPVILSEMYPSNPNEADGEMILEVNVPENLISVNSAPISDSQLQSAVNETVEALKGEPSTTEQATPSTQGTTLDKTTLSSSEQAPEVDQEATLVNISQLVTSEMNDFDEDATENVVSQANELNLDSPSIASPQQAADTTTTGVVEGQLVGEESSLQVKEVESVAPATVASSQLNLKEQKTKKELEAKLEKEAKKRAKEEEKLRKKQEKVEAEKEKKLAELEVKRKAKEEKKRVKEEAARAKKEAKELKKLEEAAKKQQKKEKQKGKKVEADTIVVDESQVLKNEPAAGPAEDEPTIVDTSNMTPVETETEVQRIVEEVVGEDGIVTKTTKTIETKYVTLRQEEVQMSERQDIPMEEFEKIESLQRVSSSSSLSSGSSIDSQGERKQKKEKEKKKVKGSSAPLLAAKKTSIVVVQPVEPYEHKELEELLSTPSYFSIERPPQLPENLAPKKEMKKRIKLNKALIKRAIGLAKNEAKLAKRKAKEAEAEIVVCDEALKEAQKELKKSLKESKHALKLAKKDHKKMDKIDKKLAKRQKKIEKKQEKLDKKAAKIAKKNEKAREKLAKKEAKLERNSSSKSSASRKSIKLEDIGEPVLRSSSRLSIGNQLGSQQLQQVETLAASTSKVGEITTIADVDKTVIDRASPASNDIQVEMSLDEGVPVTREEPVVGGSDGQEDEAVFTRTIETSTTLPDGRVLEQVEEVVLEGNEAREAADKMMTTATSESDKEEEEDVVNELPNIKGKQQQL